MHKRYKRSKGIRRRKSLKSTNAGPILAFIGTIVGILGALALIVFVAVPFLLPLIGVDFAPPWQPTPTPTPTPRPTPTPHPVKVTDPIDLQTEVLLTGLDGYQWYADPYAHGDTLYFAAGRLVEGSIRMDALISYNMDTGAHERLDIKLDNYSYVYPMCNDKWLVYFDSHQKGGGMLRAVELASGNTKDIKEVFVGQPQPVLDGDYIAWMERTGSSMDKLFVCDLNTLETATLRTFRNSNYGQSGVSLKNGQLIYAYDGTVEAATQGQELSNIHYVTVSVGGTQMYACSTYVHDPLTNGRQWAWRDGLHGMDDSLYWTQDQAAATLVERGIVEYGISDTFLAYSKDEGIYIYLFENREKLRVTPETERAQLLGVSNGTVVWMDVTSREREVLKYARIEQRK